MRSSILRTCLSLAAALLAGGCVMEVPGTASGRSGAATASYTSSWIEQIKLRLAPAAAGPRLASADTQRWHRLRLTLGRLDQSIQPTSVTVDPTEHRSMLERLGTFTPGPGYWVDVELLHVGSGGAESVVGYGRLGGDGQSVMLHAGPNAVPIEVAPTVPGVRLDASPTTLKRRARLRHETVVIVEGPRGSAEIEDGPLSRDWEEDLEFDWGTAEEADDSDEDEESEVGSDEESEDSDDEDWEDLGDFGDWLDAASAFRAGAAR